MTGVAKWITWVCLYVLADSLSQLVQLMGDLEADIQERIATPDGEEG